MSHLSIVGVLGSGTAPHQDRASAIGQWLATEKVHLLTGGGGGVMAAVSKAFHESPEQSGGLVLGIIPAATDDPLSYRPKEGYPNPWVDVPIFTHLHLSGERGTETQSRNPINVLSCNVLIALPGGAGTKSEALLALKYNRPLVAYLKNKDEIKDLPEEIPIESNLEKIKEFVRRHI